MIDRNASGRPERDARGAQTEWLEAMQSLAERIQNQQELSQQMTQEVASTYSELFNIPVPYAKEGLNYSPRGTLIVRDALHARLGP